MAYRIDNNDLAAMTCDQVLAAALHVLADGATRRCQSRADVAGVAALNFGATPAAHKAA